MYLLFHLVTTANYLYIYNRYIAIEEELTELKNNSIEMVTVILLPFGIVIVTVHLGHI